MSCAANPYGTPKAVAKVISALPKPVSTGDKGSDALSEAEYHHMCSAVTLLLENADKINVLSGALASSLKNLTEKTSDAWARCPKYVRDLDKGWMAQWIVQQDSHLSASSACITRELLDNLTVQDPMIVPNLFHMFTMTAPYTELPAPCVNSKSLTALVFKARAEQVGNLMVNWRKDHVGTGSGGQINMRTGTPFRLIFEGKSCNK
eukprot:3062469-Alexandrium_andersonii.AAC.2